MARIDYCDPAHASERTREILEKNRNANIFRMMAHSPSYFEKYCLLGRAIRVKGELDSVVRELAITRTGILCEAPYEVVAHKRIGKEVGVTDEQNAALEDWKSATCFDDLQRAALAFTDEIVTLRRPTDSTFNAIAAKTDAGGADRAAALRRLLHHDIEVLGNLRHRHAAGYGIGLNGPAGLPRDHGARNWLGTKACRRIKSNAIRTVGIRIASPRDMICNCEIGIM